ncbi:MAG: DUF499 domain-containing protein [Desulfurococcaceae archaeon]
MLTGYNKVRSDVFNETLDEKMAPSLGGVVLGEEHDIYVKPDQFFQRTLITDRMASILGNIVNVLKGEGGNKILVLNALYGGGKTHTLLTIYHALKASKELLKANSENEDVRRRVARLVDEIDKLGKPDIIVIDGYFSKLAPSPISPLDTGVYRVYTLWGYIAHALGNYDLMREHDEKRVAPEADRLQKLFRNRCAVILVDELAHYIKRFYETPDENLRRYSSAVESFMEVLAKTLELSDRVVLIISLPVVEKEKEVVVETTYQSIENTLKNIFKALKRVFTEYIEPISPRNIPALLRTRLFEEVDNRRARDVHEVLSKTYMENREIFGEKEQFIESVLEKILETYPFHPLYVETLIDILNKHEGLQKTRDLLRISRKVLRETLNDKRLYDIIMPWHIDLTKDSIRNVMLINEYEVFKRVIEEDVIERVKLYGEKQDLARITALTLLVRTFVYGGGLIIPKIDVLPRDRELALMIYEPRVFQLEGWVPKDIIDAIRWISENLIYVVKDEKTGRLWFTKWFTPIKYVEERARRIEDLLAYNKVVEYSEKLMRETADSLVQRKGARKAASTKPRVFDPELSKVNRSCEPVDVDSTRYVLLACLDVPENIEERRVRLEEVMYRTRSGGVRGYANTIYVIFPSSKNRIKYALDYAKKLIACEEVEKEGIIDKMYEKISVGEAELVREILKKKLEDYKIGVLRNLVSNTLSIFDRIAYPDYDDKRLANIVKEVDFIVQTDSLIYAAEKTLESTGIGKIKTDMNFDLLEHYLKSINIDISEGAEAKTVKTIIEFFYSNPRLPAAPRDVVIDAIKDGVRRLKIGVKSGEKVLFKKVYEGEAPEISEGETSISLKESDEVLPWRMALEEQLRKLRRREFVERGEKRIEEYVVRLPIGDKSTEEVVENIGSFNLESLRVKPIVKITRAVSVKIEFEKPVVEVKPGEPVYLEAYVSRIGRYVGEISLEPSNGSLDRNKFIIDDGFTREKITWFISKAPDKPGDHVFSIKILDSNGSTLGEAKLTVRVLEETGWIEGVPHSGLKLREIELFSGEKLSIKPLDVLNKKLSGVAIVSKASFNISAETEERMVSNVSLDVQNIQIEDLIALILSILNRFPLFKTTGSINVNLKPYKKEYFTIPELTEDEKKVLGECRIRYMLFQTGE